MCHCLCLTRRHQDCGKTRRQAREHVTVETQEGPLRGELLATYTGNPMFRFLGIPYAEPPVGDLRFQTPSQNATKKAVMVWIHGGCFTEGSGESAKPNYFVDNDVIVVSINYRLGLLGFLSTGDGVVPGNMGLKDQAEALRWVQRNIEAFGGDPDKVTIFGQSAGGATVHYHVLSSSSKGLFKNAIAMSGSALNPWAFSKNATDRAIRYAKTLGYTGQSSSDLVDFLINVEFGSLLSDETIALSDEDSKSLFTCVWVPSAEPEHESAFLTEEPWTLVAEGRFTYVPYMSGVTDLEQLAQVMSHGVLSSDSRVRNLDENFDEIVGCDLRLPTRKERLDGALSVKQFYYNGSEITMKENYTTALFDSHLFFVEGVDAVIRSTARYSSEPVFYYEFSFNGPLSSFPGGMGFLSTGDEVVPGNIGLKDQTEALRWVQRNIAAFDGDPQRVTILVQSAGGASIQYHLMAPLSKGTQLSDTSISSAISSA
ncbi:venom carboxylesterase-6-like [Schistocerca piceifrons]|uniref:venom carboxylesterase-6-like n=1 Tax=Schistocerca piceifrons TaxID=274613 RepID=UPI001F5EFF7C|nr:venom carboxylesterase-6-like [Schistocerca piceifrons]